MYSLKKATFKIILNSLRTIGQMNVAGLDEIKQWIMSLGPEAYVEEPKRLRDMVKAYMKKALVQYEGISPVYQEPAVLENRADYA